jgi:hypothetical protein
MATGRAKFLMPLFEKIFKLGFKEDPNYRSLGQELASLRDESMKESWEEERKSIIQEKLEGMNK